MNVKISRFVLCMMAGAIALWANPQARESHHDGTGISSVEAIQRLVAGNRRFQENKLEAIKHYDSANHQTLAKGQKPFAIVLSCSDSRVPPEIIFDQGLGDIFVIRVAGNITDPVVLGSMEYAAEHFGSPLIVVLGHKRCGAVTAAVEATGEPEGNIGAIIKSIVPVVQEARMRAQGKNEAELVETAIELNAQRMARNIPKQSAVIAHLAKDGLKIVVANYDLDDGKVSFLESKPAPQAPAVKEKVAP